MFRVPFQAAGLQGKVLGLDAEDLASGPHASLRP